MAPFYTFHERILKDKADQLYGGAVTQARNPGFYARLGVEDTPDGRLAMISLHVLLVLARLSKDHGGEGAGAALLPDDFDAGRKANDTPELRFGRQVMESFVDDLDQAMREIGIGDMGISKRVKGAVANFYDFAHRYQKACQVDDVGQTVQSLLCEQVPGIRDGKKETQSLAHYLVAARDHLNHSDLKDLMDGQISFPRLEDYLD